MSIHSSKSFRPHLEALEERWVPSGSTPLRTAFISPFNAPALFQQALGTSSPSRQVAAFPGTGLAGSGLSGRGLAGTGIAGTGLAGRGLPGTGLAATGLSGNGLARTGIAATGLAGNGLAGTGTAANGLAHSPTPAPSKAPPSASLAGAPMGYLDPFFANFTPPPTQPVTLPPIARFFFFRF
jgi:hypothetical protein